MMDSVGESGVTVAMCAVLGGALWLYLARGRGAREKKCNARAPCVSKSAGAVSDAVGVGARMQYLIEPPSGVEPMKMVVSAVETASKCSWTTCPGSVFDVRHAPAYSINKLKGSSAESLYEAFAVSCCSSKQKVAHIGRLASLLSVPSVPSDADALRLGLPPYIILNVMVPQYDPPCVFGMAQKDGRSVQVTVYCRLSDSVCKMMKEGKEPASIGLLRRFMDPVAGARLRKERLKLILGAVDVNESGLDRVTTAVINAWNYKPFLSKTASTFYCAKVCVCVCIKKIISKPASLLTPTPPLSPSFPLSLSCPQEYFEIDGARFLCACVSACTLVWLHVPKCAHRLGTMCCPTPWTSLPLTSALTSAFLSFWLQLTCTIGAVSLFVSFIRARCGIVVMYECWA